jgi:hypothetical protein
LAAFPSEYIYLFLFLLFVEAVVPYHLNHVRLQVFQDFFSLFGKIVNTLKKQTWFMDNVAVWRLYDSDDSDSPEDFNEEDLLTHYREKQAMRA